MLPSRKKEGNGGCLIKFVSGAWETYPGDSQKNNLWWGLYAGSNNRIRFIMVNLSPVLTPRLLYKEQT